MLDVPEMETEREHSPKEPSPPVPGAKRLVISSCDGDWKYGNRKDRQQPLSRRKTTKESSSIRHAGTGNVTPVPSDLFHPMRRRNGSNLCLCTWPKSALRFLKSSRLCKQYSAPHVYVLYTESRAALGHSFSGVWKARVGLIVSSETALRNPHFCFASTKRDEEDRRHE